MRWSLITACFAGLALFAGCYSPKVANGGFACSMTDDPPCPAGYFCVNGLCVDNPNAVVNVPDLSTGTGGNGGTGGMGGGGGGGGGMMSVDMAHAIVDMATPVSTDMATGGMCGAANAPCSGNSDCCSGICFVIICL